MPSDSPADNPPPVRRLSCTFPGEQQITIDSGRRVVGFFRCHRRKLEKLEKPEKHWLNFLGVGHHGPPEELVEVPFPDIVNVYREGFRGGHVYLYVVTSSGVCAVKAYSHLQARPAGYDELYSCLAQLAKLYGRPVRMDRKASRYVGLFLVGFVVLQVLLAIAYTVFTFILR